MVEKNWLGFHDPIQFQLAAGKEGKCLVMGSPILFYFLKAKFGKRGFYYCFTSRELHPFGIMLLKAFRDS